MEGGTWGGRHIQWVGSTYCAGANGQARWANGQVGGRWVNGEGGCAGMRHGSVCKSGVGGAKVLWGRMGLHRCDASVKYWEVCLRLASGGQALVVRPGEAVTHPTAHILVTVH